MHETALATTPNIVGTIFLAGGGSGGHIAPGIAIAEAIAEQWPGIEPIFLCSNRPVDANMLNHIGAKFAPLRATPPAARPDRALHFLLNHRHSKRAVQRMIRKLRNPNGQNHSAPIWMLSLGGFISVAPAAAARSEGIPLALLNLDAVPGKANRLIARQADLVMTATPLLDPSAMPHQNTDYPVRRDAQSPGTRQECCKQLGLDPSRPVLLVTGASQGSHSLNQFMQLWIGPNANKLKGWQVLHLTGKGEMPSVLEAVYADAGITARIEAFAHHIGTFWGAADVALSRAGANSVGEAVYNHVPTLFAPYPFHRDQHQKHNAQPVVDAGGALLAEDKVDPEANCRSLGPHLAHLIADAQARAQMMSVLAHLSSPDGATQVVRALLDINTPYSP